MYTFKSWWLYSNVFVCNWVSPIKHGNTSLLLLWHYKGRQHSGRIPRRDSIARTDPWKLSSTRTIALLNSCKLWQRFIAWARRTRRAALDHLQWSLIVVIRVWFLPTSRDYNTRTSSVRRVVEKNRPITKTINRRASGRRSAWNWMGVVITQW